MARPIFQATIVGAREVDLDVRKLSLASSDLRPVLRPWLNNWFRKMRETYSTEKTRGGRKWKGLQRITRIRKSILAKENRMKRSNIIRILRRSDRLIRSLTHKGGENIYQLDKRGGAFGSSVPYARVQHSGKRSRGKGDPKIPARPILKVLKKDQERLLDALADQIAKGGPRGREYILTRGRKSIIVERQDPERLIP